MPKSTRRIERGGRSARQRAESQLSAIRTQVAALDYVCSGTLLKRTKVCGKPQCACASKPEARHGPYYEWSRREKGRLAHTVLPLEAVSILRRAIENNRRLRKLLRAWERESARVALASDNE